MALTTVDSKGSQDNATQDSLTFQAHGTDRVELPSHAFISEAAMTKQGDDLILQTPDGQVAVIEGYFSADPAPLLQSADGAVLTPNLVDAFARSPSEYAANGTASDESPVGAVEEVKGNATVTRADGTVETVTAGTPIYQGDIIETDASGAVNIVFIDETSMAISKNARLAVDEYTFDPSTESGTTNLSVLRGLFVFTSGLIGRDDPDDVSIDTPVGSIGIRGTVIAGEINPGGESNISVLEGAIVVKNGAMETTLSQQFETVRLGGFDQPMKEMGVVPASEINTKFNSVGTVLPSLFSVIGETANDQGQQPQQNQQAPQSQQAPSDDGAAADQAPQTQDAAQQAQPAAEAPPAPAPMQDIVTLDGGNNSGLPTTQTVAGQPSASGPAPSGTPTGPAPSAPAPLAPPVMAAPADSSGPATTTPPATALPPPSVINQPTTPTAIALTFTAALVKDTADYGHLVGTVTTANASGSTVTYKFANGTNVSDSGFFSISGDGSIRLTTSGAAQLNSTLDTVQLGSFAVVATTTDGRTATTSVTPVVVDANAITLNLTDPASGGVVHITDTINNQFGYSISAVGDVNRDGFDDFVVSNNSPTSAQNHSYLISGQNGMYIDGPVASLGAMTPLANPGGTLSNLNTVVSGIGDFNGDGKTDYAIGQAGALAGAIASGNFYIFSGINGTTDHITLTGTTVPGDQIGSSIAGVGDFNNDGFADVIVGAPGAGSGNGRTYLVKGTSDWNADLTNTTSSSTHTDVTQGTTLSGYGSSVRGVGDINGDGFSDYAVGAPGSDSGNGYVDIVYGYANGGSAPTTTRIAGATGQGLGTEIISLGDINGDGYSDLMASGGDMSLHFIMGSASGGSAGASINLNGAGYEINGANGIGDFNGDGLDDFVISMADANQTKMYVVYGKDGVTPNLSFDYLKDPMNAFEMVYNGANNSSDPLEISGLGDVNGDGRDDFGIGVSNLNGAAAGDGGVIVVYGRDGRGDAPQQNAATANGQSLVGSVTANDMNDGGFADVSMRSGAGEDIMRLSNTDFRNVDGGGGYDTLVAGQNLDFSNINFEQMSGIEKIQFGAANTTITLTLENIFNLLKTSDTYFDGTEYHSGYLKITSNGLAGSKLIIDADLAADIVGATAGQIDTEALEKYTGSGGVLSTDTAGGSGTYDKFEIGGYTLLIENTVQVDVV